MAGKRVSVAPEQSFSRSAFLNVPFDKAYEPLHPALIAGLSGFGLMPRSVLEIPGSQRRLDRLTDLVARCRYSFHDISRVELDRIRPQVPRFNMPFELGVAVGNSEHMGDSRSWYVFETRQFRTLKIAERPERDTVRDLRAICRDVRTAATELRRDLATDSLYDTRPFQDLVFGASLSARRQIGSLRSSN